MRVFPKKQKTFFQFSFYSKFLIIPKTFFHITFFPKAKKIQFSLFPKFLIIPNRDMTKIKIIYNSNPHF